MLRASRGSTHLFSQQFSARTVLSPLIQVEKLGPSEVISNLPMAISQQVTESRLQAKAGDIQDPRLSLRGAAAACAAGFGYPLLLTPFTPPRGTELQDGLAPGPGSPWVRPREGSQPLQGTCPCAGCPSLTGWSFQES